VFRNSSNAFTTTLQASTGAAANLIYTWPTAAPAAGNILSSDASGNLTWTAAGAGNMVLATAGQIVTGSKIYADATLLLRNPATTFSTTLSAGASTAARTITFPDLTGTVALLDNAQIFTGAKTFQAQVNIGNATYATTTLQFAGTTANAIAFNNAGTAAVSQTGGVRTAGVKLILYPSSNYSVTPDFAIGMASTTEMYIGSTGATNTEVSMYFGSAKLGSFYSAGLAVRGGGLLVNTGASTTTGVGNALSTLIFSTSVSAAPSDQNLRSNGTRIVLQPNTNVGWADAAIGYNDADKETWITGAKTSGSSDGRISFYAGGVTSGTSFRRVGYFSGTGLVFDSPGNTTNAPITFNGTTINWINFGTIGSGAPSTGNARSAGLKIALYPNVSVNATDYGIGVDTANYETWISGGVTGANGGMVSFWVGALSNFKRTVWITENALNLAAGTNIVTATTGTGGQIGTSTSQLVGFHGVAGTAQRAAAAQAAVATTAATQTTPWGYSTAAQADGVITLLNEIRTVLVNKGLMKGSA
jgi:hypothetical protein